ncbi:hypothetical protein AWENTII_012296 [Aspergillus wentii]
MGGLLKLAIVAVLVATLYRPVSWRLTMTGIFNKPAKMMLVEGQNLFKIEDTIHCEDLHHYKPANKLFTACEDSIVPRFEWFPPLALFKKPTETTGSIHVIDPKTLKSTRLAYENFGGPFVTHGIDVIQDPNQVDAVYILAVNHLPNPEYYQDVPRGGDVPKARSQVELFHHVLESDMIKHVRSIRHPLITTPNDIYAESSSSFYVTNDHVYREGIKRKVEDYIPLSTWTNIIHVEMNSLSSMDAVSDIDASVALTGLYNNNGLGHNPSGEIIITCAMGGAFYRAQSNSNNHTISILEKIPLDHAIDNPTYYEDPYRTESHDASGYLFGGLARPIDVAKTVTDPAGTESVMVWHVQPNGTDEKGVTKWKRRLIFEDDGSTIRGASAALLIPIEPQSEGEKKAMLFVTGFLSASMIAAEIDL